MTVVLPTGGGTKRKELGHLLVEQGLLKEQQLTLALTFQKQTGKPLGEVLVELGLVGTEDVTRARAQQVDAAYVAMEDVAVDKELERHAARTSGRRTCFREPCRRSLLRPLRRRAPSRTL